MINPFKDVNWNPGLSEKRKFAVSLVIGFPCVGLVSLFLRRIFSGAWHVETSLWIGGTGLALGLVLLALPILARPFYLVWYFLACSVGIVVSNVLLSAFYYLVVTPIGLVVRALGRPPLKKTFDASAQTYWRDAEHVPDATRYYRQF
jgi:Saxitoxin biosynthesis operon protein SxtJ